jgi:hypothetical protein
MSDLTWRQRIPGCFGDQDVAFARYPDDERRAREAIAMAKAEDVSRDDFKKEMIDFITTKFKLTDLLDDHIRNQLAKLDEMWKA